MEQEMGKEKLDEIYLFRIEQQFPLNSATLDKVIKEKAKTGGWEVRKALKLVKNLAASYGYLTEEGIVDTIRAGWEGKALSNREFYAAGTWGPVAAEDLLAQSGHVWRDPQPIT